jgi:hypothetical protein
MSSPRIPPSRQPVAATSDTTKHPAPVASSKPNTIISHSGAFIDPERRQAMISEAAYYCAEQRGFAASHELDDWLAAERQIDQALSVDDVPSLSGESD